MRTLNLGILAAGLLSATALVSSANASLITTASLFSPLPPVGSTTNVIDLQSAPLGSGFFAGNGYTISFAVAPGQGVVQGASAGNYAIPVAGVQGTQPTYLTGNFGSSKTPNPADSGNYLSTGTGTITLTFLTPQKSLALLWGSIDTGNAITFNNASGDTLTGAEVQSIAAGFTTNGFQGPTGSAYVSTTSDTTFTTVTFSSDVVSFEAAGIAASTGTFTPTVPLPASAPMFGAALLALGAVGYGAKRKKAAASA